MPSRGHSRCAACHGVGHVQDRAGKWHACTCVRGTRATREAIQAMNTPRGVTIRPLTEIVAEQKAARDAPHV